MNGYFEDIAIGETSALGEHIFIRDEITRFAGQWDPQRFHLDDAAARESLFGALSASGWHTAAIWMKLMAAHTARLQAQLPAQDRDAARPGPSPGFRDLRWLKPVFVDDVITYSSQVTAKSDIEGRPEWGLVTTYNEGRNQTGELVFCFTGLVYAARKGASAVSVAIRPAPAARSS